MESLENKIFNNSRRIVIKVGSSLVIGNKSYLINKKILKNIVSEIKTLVSNKKEVLIVSSGALALGKKQLKTKKVIKISEKQAAAAVGQVLLVNAWREAFYKCKINCAQILLTHLDAEIRSSSLNARNTIESLIKFKTIPIINENDTVATKELRYGDNDQLAARVAQITSSDLLILLSDVDGLFDCSGSSTVNTSILVEQEGKASIKFPPIHLFGGNYVACFPDAGAGGTSKKIYTTNKGNVLINPNDTILIELD